MYRSFKVASFILFLVTVSLIFINCGKTIYIQRGIKRKPLNKKEKVSFFYKEDQPSSYKEIAQTIIFAKKTKDAKKKAIKKARKIGANAIILIQTIHRGDFKKSEYTFLLVYIKKNK